MTLRRMARRLVAVAIAFAEGIAGADDRVPRVYLVGDSTVRNSTKGQLGWGDPFATLVDPAKATVVNRARGGRSSRTFLTEGLWGDVVARLKPGDVVLIQFGHNDGGSLTDGRGRASLKGNGDETRDVTDPRTGKPEVVHSYGWYLRNYIKDAKGMGATPVVLSPVPRNIWKDGRVARASNDYGRWAAEAAKQADALFLDLNDAVARRYEADGEAKVRAEYFSEADHTHTTPAGAPVTARVVADLLADTPGSPLRDAFARPTP